MLMGFSDNRVAVNTRDVLEKGLTFVGSSRSGREDFRRSCRDAIPGPKSFEKALSVMEKFKPFRYSSSFTTDLIFV